MTIRYASSLSIQFNTVKCDLQLLCDNGMCTGLLWIEF